MNSFDVRQAPKQPSLEELEERRREREVLLRKKSSRTLRRLLVISTTLVLLLLIGGASVWFFYHHHNETSAPTTQSGDSFQMTLAAVGKLMVLPQGETPTLAKVSDPAALANEPFFVKAEKGDIVLIYGAAHKAILYSPSKNRIIEVAPINLGNGAATSTLLP